MTAEQLAQLREVAANLKDVARHSVDGYGRQDIHYNDPEGEFVFYSDYAALLDELEAAKKSNEFLKGQLSELANFNPDWDKLEASYESWREIAAELLVAKDRIAELEAREVVLPDAWWVKQGSQSLLAYEKGMLLDALTAAGIITKVGE